MAERFVRARNLVNEPRHQTPPPSTQPQQKQQQQPQPRLGRPDRAALGAGAKIKRSRGERPSLTSPAPPHFSQMLPSTAPAPGYDSNPSAPRNTFPNQKYHQQETHVPMQEAEQQPEFVAQDEQQLLAQGGAFDDTVTDGFEDTKSDLQYNGYDMNNGEGPIDDDDYELQDQEGRQQRMQIGSRQPVTHHDHHSKHSKQHTLHHQQSRSPLVNQDLPQQHNAYAEQPTHGIVGRFAAPAAPAGDKWQQDIAHRNANGLGHQVGTSSLRRHPSDLLYSEDNQQQDMGRRDGDEYVSSESGADSDLPEQQNRADGHGMPQIGDEGFEPRTDGAESGTSTVTRRAEIQRVLDARLMDPKRNELDHDDETLKVMTFADLKKELWDAELGAQPGGQKRQNPTQTQDYTVEEGIEYVVQHEGAEAQVQFFEDLSMQEFEQAGDILIGKFSDLMKKITEARKNKRKIVSDFEKEIEAREKAVRGKCENLDKQLNDMRSGGEGVLRGKV